jgi:hypothetical protein
MSTVTMSQLTVTPQPDRIRDAMSLQNIMTSPAAVTTPPDVTTSGPVLAPPTTPTKTPAPKVQEEEIASPGSAMSDVVTAGDEKKTMSTFLTLIASSSARTTWVLAAVRDSTP